MNKLDFLIINNCPSFYKINLYNEISKKCKIHVIFIALTDQVVIETDYKKQIEFSYSIIDERNIRQRNKFIVFGKILLLTLKMQYKYIIYGGYDLPELRLTLFFTKKNKNCLQAESSIKESRVKGFISIIKKILLTRISVVLPSGDLQTEVFSALNYNGRYIQTKGVGIFNKRERQLQKPKNKIFKYIYVGRLIDLKNLEFLIQEFNENGKYLTIVGTGNRDSELKKMANDNIHFMGFVPNKTVGDIYMSHDVFILPSLSEPWGLVVEEAIYWGLPVIVSNAVGCQKEMVIQPDTGIVFNLSDINGLKDAISEIEDKFDFYQKNVLAFDFKNRDMEQVNAYLEILR